MPSTLRKNLNLCFTKIKLSSTTSPPSLPMSPTSSITSTSQTPDSQNCPSTSMPTKIANTTRSSSSSTSILIKNFNSVYESNSKSLINSPSFSALSNLSEAATVADLSTVLASQRFFFSSPGLSNSIIQSTSTSTEHDQQTLLKKSIAVPTFSPDPYTDFRRSMQEMVEARELLDVKELSNWEFLHELLLCYLALNPKTTHKFIISAFADLLVSILPSPLDTHGGYPETQVSGDVCQVSR